MYYKNVSKIMYQKIPIKAKAGILVLVCAVICSITVTILILSGYFNNLFGWKYIDIELLKHEQRNAYTFGVCNQANYTTEYVKCYDIQVSSQININPGKCFVIDSSNNTILCDCWYSFMSKIVVHRGYINNNIQHRTADSAQIFYSSIVADIYRDISQFISNNNITISTLYNLSGNREIAILSEWQTHAMIIILCALILCLTFVTYNWKVYLKRNNVFINNINNFDNDTYTIF
jgi:hypothetical protein